MSYHLLIVEDEEMIMNKILNNVKWEEHNFDKIYTANDGLKAFDIIKKEKIDIVITDIQMPGMDGIALTRKIKSFNEKIKVVIITAHAEFEYAMESIKLNVDNYILKPFITKNLLDIVLELRDQLTNEKKHKEEYELLKKQIRENKKVLVEKFFVDLLNNNYVGNIEYDINYLGLPVEKRNYFFVAICQITDYYNMQNKDDEEYKYIYNILFYEWLQNYYQKDTLTKYVINYKLDQIVLILFDEDREKFMALEAMIKKIKEEIGLGITIGMGNSYNDIEHMYISCNEAKSALYLKTIYGKNKVYSFNDLNFSNKNYSELLHMVHSSRLFMHLKVGSIEEIKKEIMFIIKKVRESGLNVEAINTIIHNIILLSFKSINEMGYNIYDIFDVKLEMNFDVRQLESLFELEEWFFKFFEKVNNYLNSQRNNQNEVLIYEIKDYIDKKYVQNISLTSIAKQFNISTSYLSILFNNYMGKKFIDYLTNIRMQKAKEYLKGTDMRIYEITEKVGYRDPYYFSAAFKKAIGVSPSEYRNNLNIFD